MAAGELPLELVPFCEVSVFGKPAGRCRCCSPPAAGLPQEPCGSRNTKSILISRSLLCVRGGLVAWVVTLLTCLSCVLGFIGCYTSLQRWARA